MIATIPMELGLTVWDLSYAEHLLVWAIRHWVDGRQCWAVVEREFRDACGSPADSTVLTALGQFLVRIAVHGRRQIRIGYRGYPGVSPDEMVLLQLVAAAQADEPYRIACRLPWLFAMPEHREARELLTQIARPLAACGLTVPLRDDGQDRWTARSRPA